MTLVEKDTHIPMKDIFIIPYSKFILNYPKHTLFNENYLTFLHSKEIINLLNNLCCCKSNLKVIHKDDIHCIWRGAKVDDVMVFYEPNYNCGVNKSYKLVL